MVIHGKQHFKKENKTNKQKSLKLRKKSCQTWSARGWQGSSVAAARAERPTQPAWAVAASPSNRSSEWVQDLLLDGKAKF